VGFACGDGRPPTTATDGLGIGGSGFLAGPNSGGTTMGDGFGGQVGGRARRRFATALLCGATLAAASCGSSDDGAAVTTTERVATTTTGVDTTTTEATTTTSTTTTTTTAPTTTTTAPPPVSYPVVCEWVQDRYMDGAYNGVRVTGPGVDCEEAERIVDRYIWDDSLPPPEGSSGFREVERWTCWSDTIPTDTGAYGVCSLTIRDDRHGMIEIYPV
jgi:hypothetical protein